MLCKNCNREFPDDNNFCPHCGTKALAEGAAPSFSSPAKTLRNLLIAVALIGMIACGVCGWTILSKATTYSSALKQYEAGAFTEAAELFASLGEYKDAAAYIPDCSYQQALAAASSGNYSDAISLFEQLGSYKDSMQQLEKAKFDRKYSVFNQALPAEEESYSLRTTEEVETFLTEWAYGDWYHLETGEKISVGITQIGGRDYIVDYATSPTDWTDLYFHYMDAPETIYCLSLSYEHFEYIDVSVDTLRIGQINADTPSDTTYCAIPLDEYSDYAAQDAEVRNSRPAYSDEQIISMAFSTFKDKAKGYARILRPNDNPLLQKAEYSNPSVIYNPSTRTYICTFQGIYNTNIFDFLGTSKLTYSVYAEYVDTGSGLSMMVHNVN